MQMKRIVDEALSDDVAVQAGVDTEDLDAVANGDEVFVLNRTSGRAHRLSKEANRARPACDWITCCGWRFANDGLITRAKPRKSLCRRTSCFLFDGSSDSE